MDESFLLTDASGVQAFLRQFSAAARRKGEALVRVGAVSRLTASIPGAAYSAVVRDGQEFEVEVYLVEKADDESWSGDCSCPEEFDCAHVFAVTRELLAQHSAALVRNLSAGTVKPTGRLAKGAPESASPTPGELGRRLSAALGRTLLEPEARFIKKVQAVHQRCRQIGHITHWDFQEMGLPLKGGYGWDGLKIWPEPPRGEHEFWLYVANAAHERGVPIPPFMEEITDLREIQERITRWQRTCQIENWKQTLANLRLEPNLPQPHPQGETDLRLVVTETELQLAWRRPDQAEFEPVKQGHLHQLGAEYEQNICRLTDEAEWLWPSVGPLLHYGTALHWNRLDSEASRVLRQLLRLPVLESRVVSAKGQPLARPAAPLRWELLPAASAEDDYRFRLVQADGSALPALLAVLSGSPALYLTAEAVFTGPGFRPSVLDPAKETRIPAPALECAPGVALLHSLGVELPPALRDRVQTLPYEVVIRCQLRPTWPGSNMEDCVVSAHAAAADGRRLTWAGHTWEENASKSGRKKQRDEGRITIYDSAVLAQTQALLEPLQLRPAYYGRGFLTRVTKRFPETFAVWLQSVPPHIRVELAGELASLAAGDVAGRVKLDVTEAEIDWFDLRVVLDVSDATLTAEEIKLLLKAKGKYVRLSGKGWRRLHFDLTEQENERLARLGLSAQELSAEPQRLHALQLADPAAKTFLPEQQVERLQRRVSEIKTRVAPSLPSIVTAELRPYQVEGFHFLAYLSANRFGGILADDMGLGKTLQALAWLVWLRQEQAQAPAAPGCGSASGGPAEGVPSAPEVKPALVVCPKSVMDNWRAEAERFTPGFRVRIWSPSELERLGAELGSADLHVLNYSQLRMLGESLAAVRWQAVILDEGQYIKNPNSQTAQVARSLRAEQRLVLSGTPIENRLLDLWSLMAFAMPGVLGSRPHFARIYGAKDDPFARRRLASRIRPFLLRRTKGQVAKDLPDRIEEDLFCEMEGEQQLLYRAELKRAQQLLLGIKTQKELAQQQFHFLVSLLRLRQICCDPRLRDSESTAPSAKVEALLEQLEPLMEDGQKVLVFSQFVELLDLLRPVLEEREWPVFYLAGDTENRGELVKQFQSAEGAGVFLISLKAGGFGLNLTAASYVVLFDPWWNPAVENQAIDRTHRIGQVNKVIAYRLLIKNSIEEKIRALQKTKKALAEDVLGEERFAQSLTLEDMKFLFAE
jgi:SNF2-related domain/Helicase conserved C-terminal domain